ncbi:hypothetical protein Q4512_12235 [Oceanihabitans sp. 2_MG-2023]|uniref:hypothetical protein n=1 Tax=Oceanihabitans sp. 2_MG-2023 TaxID=3062661 RepID=UPI0026E17B17|nr:hypothetical protein [Oceanihabitans sp. 2_MG-2023]MDO6597687.1 hypothetical protein [Oceanihabitans sp. 2_MG-2023]
MNLFIKKTLTFCLFLLVLISLRFWILPYYYGNDIYASKIAYFEKTKTPFNTVLFGSSRLYRQLNPRIIDSITTDYNIKTFNFASPATFYPESTYLYENFIEENDSKKIKYAIIELQHLELFKNNAKTIKGNYWNTTSNMSHCISLINDSHYSKKKKNRLKKTILLSFIYRVLDFTSIKDFFKTKNTFNNNNNNGYYSLQQEVADKTSNLESILEYYKKFNLDISNYKKLVQTAKLRDNLDVSKLTVNNSHLKHLIQIIKLSKEKGIDVIYVLPPKLNLEYYKALLPIVNLLPKNNIIDLSSYKDHTNLYGKDASFDFYHLNNKGSRLFSIVVGEKLLANLNKAK